MSDDQAVNVLNSRIDDVLNRTDHLAVSLADHVRECAQLQRKALVVMTALLAWQVIHSPEAAKIVGLVFG